MPPWPTAPRTRYAFRSTTGSAVRGVGSTAPSSSPSTSMVERNRTSPDVGGLDARGFWDMVYRQGVRKYLEQRTSVYRTLERLHSNLCATNAAVGFEATRGGGRCNGPGPGIRASGGSLALASRDRAKPIRPAPSPTRTNPLTRSPGSPQPQEGPLVFLGTHNCKKDWTTNSAFFSAMPVQNNVCTSPSSLPAKPARLRSAIKGFMLVRATCAAAAVSMSSDRPW